MKKILFMVLLGTLTVLGGTHSLQAQSNGKSKKEMIKISILYPNAEGKTFNMDYYKNNHMPMLAGLYGSALKKMEIDKGLSGRTPEEQIPFLAIGHLYFESFAAYQKAFAPHAQKIRGDIPNYTNIKPIVQISKVINSN